MNQQSSRTLQETRTSLAPAEVLAAAANFFALRPNIYAAFVEQESPTHVALRGQGGEEILVGVRPLAGGTAVTGSTYLFDQQVLRFFASLPPGPEDVEPLPEPGMEPDAPSAAAAGAP
jgi:hypothetical protein